MITKELFVKYLKSWKQFESGIRRVEVALSGKQNYSTNLLETDWFEAVDKMLSTFIDSYFTEAGSDLIFAFLFDHLDYSWGVTLYEESGEKICIETAEGLWDYMIKEKDIYFAN